ncbi:MAG: hypothetical protein WCG14_04910 [Chlamydiia bacterium]
MSLGLNRSVGQTFIHYNFYIDNDTKASVGRAPEDPFITESSVDSILQGDESKRLLQGDQAEGWCKIAWGLYVYCKSLVNAGMRIMLSLKWGDRYIGVNLLFSLDCTQRAPSPGRSEEVGGLPVIVQEEDDEPDSPPPPLPIPSHRFRERIYTV